jgi:hypothetical protein
LGVVCLLGGVALADSITPAVFEATLGVGESVTIEKIVTVSAGTPTSSKVDVFFLADTTGSMGGQIAAVKTAALTILTGAAGLGDVAFGVGEYRDTSDAYAYRLNQSITTSIADAQAGINMWVASGGGDYAEANLYALQQVASATPPAPPTGWRPGSERVLVWFGDAPGHDPRNGATEVTATAALIAAGVQVEAIDVGGLNASGQAVRIANATGGHYRSRIDTATIVAAIQAAIVTAVEDYSTVALDLSEVPAGVTVSAVPGSHVGDYDRSVERTFGFSVTFTGDAAGTYDFPIFATVDGGRVAGEEDSITVGAPALPDAGSTLALMGLALTGLAAIRRIFA